MASILSSIKKMLGIEVEYHHFDQELIMYINSTFMYLTQLGVGPKTGFSIEGDFEEWSNFLSDRLDLESVKSLMYLKVRLIFDPPSNSFIVESMNRQISELEWRLNMQAEGGFS